MDYRQSLAFLEELKVFGIHLGLQRIEALLALLGQPQKKAGEIIHIAGTNGKGSTGAMLEAMLRQSFQTGFFTSPHLYQITERFRLNGSLIPKEEFAALMERLAAAVTEMQEKGLETPTAFEVETALALLWFAEKGTDKAILEAGLGGGLDSTRAAGGKLAIITNIGLDHMEYLGADLEEIAAAKAGIIAPGGIVITGAEGAAWAVIARKAAAQKARLITLGQELQLFPLGRDEAGQYFDLKTEKHLYRALFIPLQGIHQLDNAALAIAAAELCGAGPEEIKTGLAQAVWPGRLELLPGQPPVLLDGAHNPQGMAALAKALPPLVKNRPLTALIGMLDDKARSAALEHLAPYLHSAVISRPPAEGRTEHWAETGRILQKAGLPVYWEEEIPAACQKAVDLAGEQGMVLVCGSLFLLAPARAWFLARQSGDIFLPSIL